jgi:hypothetical protein
MEKLVMMQHIMALVEEGVVQEMEVLVSRIQMAVKEGMGLCF